APFISVVNVRRSRYAPLARPMFVRSFQASSMYLRRFASAFGAGSVAMTSNPRARYSAAQLAPMTPVPTIAIRRIGLLYDILVFLRVDFCVSDSGEISLRDEPPFRLSGCRSSRERCGPCPHRQALFASNKFARGPDQR